MGGWGGKGEKGKNDAQAMVSLCFALSHVLRVCRPAREPVAPKTRKPPKVLLRVLSGVLSDIGVLSGVLPRVLSRGSFCGEQQEEHPREHSREHLWEHPDF